MNKSNVDVVIFALNRVDSKYSSTALSIGEELAKINRVFYVNNPYTINEVLFGLKSNSRFKRLATRLLTLRATIEKEESRGFISVVPPAIIPVNWISSSFFYSILSNFNAFLVKKSIRKAIRNHQIKDFIYLNIFNPYYSAKIPRELGSKLVIYQSVDDISQNPYTAKHGPRLENKIVAESDLVLTTSTKLKEKLSAINANTFPLYNAVNYKLFHQTLTKEFKKPDDILSINDPIIAYIGNLDDTRVDFDLLLAISEFHTDKTLLLIGPITGVEFKNKKLEDLSNVKYIGAKKLSEIPQYLQFIDIALIPFKINTLTKSIYPLKINEYMAAGRGVVSTRFSKDIENFNEHILISDTHHEFNNAIDQVMENNKAHPELKINRSAIASENTWEKRIEQFWKIVSNQFN